MSLVTCIVAPEELERSTVELAGETFHHLFNVRRLVAGAEVRLVDGLGSARWGRVERVDSGRATLRLGAPAEPNEARLRLEIWAAPPRPQRAAWLVEKTTEVGVSAIRWIDTERVGREMTPSRLDRLRRVAAAAVEQSHRSRVPEISGLLPWPEVMRRLGKVDSAWFLHAGEGARLPDLVDRPSAILLVGPEGGWSDQERSELLLVGARPVDLGPRVVRLETAAVVGAALALCR